MLNLFFDICGQFSEEEAKTLQAGLGRHLGQFTVTTWREAGSQRGWHRCCCRCATGDSGEDSRKRRAMRGKCIPVVRAATVRVGSCPLPRTSQASGAEPPSRPAVSADDSSPLKCGATARAEYEAIGYYTERKRKKKKKKTPKKLPLKLQCGRACPQFGAWAAQHGQLPSLRTGLQDFILSFHITLKCFEEKLFENTIREGYSEGLGNS